MTRNWRGGGGGGEGGGEEGGGNEETTYLTNDCIRIFFMTGRPVRSIKQNRKYGDSANEVMASCWCGWCCC